MSTARAELLARMRVLLAAREPPPELDDEGFAERAHDWMERENVRHAEIATLNERWRALGETSCLGCVAEETTPETGPS